MDHLSENEWITIPAGKDVTTERKGRLSDQRIRLRARLSRTS